MHLVGFIVKKMTDILHQHVYMSSLLGKRYVLLLPVNWGAREWNIRIQRNVGKLFAFVIFGRA